MPCIHAHLCWYLLDNLHIIKFQAGSNLPSTDTEFCLLLCGDFSSAVQLSSAREMLEYILKLPDDKDDGKIAYTFSSQVIVQMKEVKKGRIGFFNKLKGYFNDIQFFKNHVNLSLVLSDIIDVVTGHTIGIFLCDLCFL